MDVEISRSYFVPLTSGFRGYETQYIIPEEDKPPILRNGCKSVVNCNRLVVVPSCYIPSLSDTGESLDLEKALDLRSKIISFYFAEKVRYIGYVPLRKI